MTEAAGPPGRGGVPAPAVRVLGLDHVVLRVADVEASVRWYADLLGLTVERLDEWRRDEAPFVSVRIDASTIIDLVESAPDGTNVDHLALVVADVDLDELAASGRFEAVFGPKQLSGAQGVGTGMYVLDPDGHRVELRTYP